MSTGEGNDPRARGRRENLSRAQNLKRKRVLEQEYVRHDRQAQARPVYFIAVLRGDLVQEHADQIDETH